MEIIRDLLWLWILGALGGTGYILWAIYVRDAAAAAPAGARPAQQITTRRTPAGPPPVAKPASAPPLATPPARTPAAPPVGEHQRRGSAPTVKLPAAEPGARDASEDQAAADLFGGLSAAKAKADAAPPVVVPAAPQLALPKNIVEQAARIEERGFHVGAAKIEVPAEKPPVDTKTPTDGVPGQPRSQTAELDDILKRIDAVLSESTAPQSEATLTGQQNGGQQTMPLPQSPPTEKLERRSTDPNQQKLF